MTDPETERRIRSILYLPKTTVGGFSPFPEEQGLPQCSVIPQQNKLPMTTIPQLGPSDALVEDLGKLLSGYANYLDALAREAKKRQEQRDKTIELFLDSIKAIRREKWGKKTPKHKQMDLDWDYNTVVIHHSGNHGYKDPKEIERLHMEDNEWDDVGYHFMVSRSGEFYEGRRLTYKGSHVSKANTGKIGILVMGDFHPSPKPFHSFNPADWDDNGDDALSATQLKAVQDLIKKLKGLFSQIKTLGGHRDYVTTTECPGDLLYAYLGNLRKAVDLGAP